MTLAQKFWHDVVYAKAKPIINKIKTDHLMKEHNITSSKRYTIYGTMTYEGSKFISVYINRDEVKHYVFTYKQSVLDAELQVFSDLLGIIIQEAHTHTSIKFVVTNRYIRDWYLHLITEDYDPPDCGHWIPTIIDQIRILISRRNIVLFQHASKSTPNETLLEEHMKIMSNYGVHMILPKKPKDYYHLQEMFRAMKITDPELYMWSRKKQ